MYLCLSQIHTHTHIHTHISLFFCLLGQLEERDKGGRKGAGRDSTAGEGTEGLAGLEGAVCVCVCVCVCE